MKMRPTKKRLLLFSILLFAIVICFIIIYILTHPVLYYYDTVSLNQIAENNELYKTIIVKNNDIFFLDFQSDKSECAKYVAQAYNKIFNPWWITAKMDYALFDGIFGNAWDLPKHISSLQGSLHYLNKDNSASFRFHKGDIIGAYYPISSFNDEAKKHGCAFTHVMLVIGLINGRPIVAHHYKSPLLANAHSDRIDFLDKTSIFTPIVVMRTWRVEHFLNLQKK